MKLFFFPFLCGYSQLFCSSFLLKFLKCASELSQSCFCSWIFNYVIVDLCWGDKDWSLLHLGPPNPWLQSCTSLWPDRIQAVIEACLNSAPCLLSPPLPELAREWSLPVWPPLLLSPLPCPVFQETGPWCQKGWGQLPYTPLQWCHSCKTNTDNWLGSTGYCLNKLPKTQMNQHNQVSWNRMLHSLRNMTCASQEFIILW